MIPAVTTSGALKSPLTIVSENTEKVTTSKSPHNENWTKEMESAQEHHTCCSCHESYQDHFTSIYCREDKQHYTYFHLYRGYSHKLQDRYYDADWISQIVIYLWLNRKYCRHEYSVSQPPPMPVVPEIIRGKSAHLGIYMNMGASLLEADTEEWSSASKRNWVKSWKRNTLQ